MWQLSWIPLSDAIWRSSLPRIPAYRKARREGRRLTEDSRHHEYEEFQRAQTRLWKTPEYRSVHRRYSGRLQELNRITAATRRRKPLVSFPIDRTFACPILLNSVQ
jgi:hypothetical protein